MLIAILLAAFISLSHAHTLFKKQSNLVVRTVKETDNRLFASLENKPGILSLENEDNITSSNWGVFEKLTVVSTAKKYSFTKIALSGGQVKERTALYLKESHQPLILVGNTRIEGRAFLPKQGARAGNISGKSYYGSSLIYGSINESTDKLPLLEDTFKHKLDSFMETGGSNNAELISGEANTSIRNSFKKPTQLMYLDERVDLDGIELIGNIIVRSEQKIRVGTSAVLKDIILIAPEIEIEAGVKGNFQAFATKNISVGKNCELSYPTALVLNIKTQAGQDPNKEKRQIFLDQGASVKGIIAQFGTAGERNFKPQVMIEENALIEGEVYCEARMELKGSVYGSVFTSGFVSNQAGSVYLNHIFNGKIIASALTDQYAGLTFSGTKKNIVKWLY